MFRHRCLPHNLTFFIHITFYITRKPLFLEIGQSTFMGSLQYLEHWGESKNLFLWFLRLCRELTQDQRKNPISQHLMSAFTKRCCKFALASWIRDRTRIPNNAKKVIGILLFVLKWLLTFIVAFLSVFYGCLVLI